MRIFIITPLNWIIRGNHKHGKLLLWFKSSEVMPLRLKWKWKKKRESTNAVGQYFKVKEGFLLKKFSRHFSPPSSFAAFWKIRHLSFQQREVAGNKAEVCWSLLFCALMLNFLLQKFKDLDRIRCVGKTEGKKRMFLNSLLLKLEKEF